MRHFGKVWYVIIAILPIYGALNSQTWDGHQLRAQNPAIGFTAGLILALFLATVTWLIQKLLKKIVSYLQESKQRALK